MDELDPARFEDGRARAVVARWVASVDDPQLNWAWDAVCGVLAHYAALNAPSASGLVAARREVWFDWFAAARDGEAHFGVHGVMQEFLCACPEPHVNAQIATMEEAFAAGFRRPKRRSGGVAGGGPPAPEKSASPAETLRLVSVRSDLPPRGRTADGCRAPALRVVSSGPPARR
jgi:hypothetical protein